MNTLKLSKTIAIFIVAVGVIFLCQTQSKADETQDLKNQIKALQEKVELLEKQAAKQSVQTPPEDIQTFSSWDPFAEMRMMDRQMRQLMKNQMVDFNPKQDLKETADHYILSMDLPGMDKDKINVQIKSGTLIVSGDRSSEIKEEKPNQFYRQERSFGHFYRTMPLPTDAKADNIDAKYVDGVLTVKIARDKTPSKSPQGQKIVVK